MKERKAVYVLFILIQSLVYGIGNPLTKTAYDSITPFWLLTFRFALAFLLLFLWRGRKIAGQLKDVSWTVWMPSALCCAGAYISCNLALNLTAATNVGFIMSLPVLFSPLLSTIVLRTPYQWKRLPLQLITVISAAIRAPLPLVPEKLLHSSTLCVLQDSLSSVSRLSRRWMLLLSPRCR